MTITYTNTRRDLLAFQLYHSRRSPVLLLSSVICMMVMGFIFFDSADAVALIPRVVATVVFLLLLLFAFMLLRLGIFALFVALRQAGDLTPEKLTLGESGLRIETDTSFQDHQWRGIKKACRTRKHMFIYLTPAIACVVPCRAFSDAAERDQFEAFVLAKVSAN
jgi:hypothetical protein